MKTNKPDYYYFDADVQFEDGVIRHFVLLGIDIWSALADLQEAYQQKCHVVRSYGVTNA